jgi:hypothetical protein
LDELTYTQEEAWLRLEGRLRDPKARRLCGFAAWTPKGYDWVYRKFVAKPSETYRTIYAKPSENRHLLGRDPEFYSRLRESYDEKFYAQEVLGSYLNLDGSRVYSSFDTNKHITELSLDPRRPILWALDFNVDPMSSVIAQITGGRVQVLDEIVIRHGTTRQACEAFLERFPKHEPGVVIFGDASGSAQQTSGSSDYEMVKEHFAFYSSMKVDYRVPKANPSVRERINLTNAKLQSAGGDIGLLVDKKCKELIQDFEQVCFKGDTGQIDKDRDRMRTHLSGALGYLLWQECRALPQIGERSRRIV